MFSNYVAIFTVTLMCSVFLVWSQRWHGHFSLDAAGGVQNHHKLPTIRIGGVSIAMGLLVAWQVAEPDVRVILGPMLMAGLLPFAFGFAEDITNKVGIFPRLIATMASGFVAWLFSGVAMRHTGLPPLDWLLQFTPLAVIFTAFAVGGVVNAINIIDGFNGLAVGSVAIMLSAMGLMALREGDAPLATLCFSLAVCALGFCAANWPLGKLFLGDGGAYLLGFLVAWVAVMLPMRHAEINAWATILVCAYPVVEVAFSIHRRKKRQRSHTGQADKLHLHHLVHRRLICQVLPDLSAELKNGFTSPLCWLFVAMPAAVAVHFSHDTAMLALAFGGVVLTYSAIYARLSQFRWCLTAYTLRHSKSELQP